MPTPDIVPLLENFPPQSATDRAALLEFARRTRLVYGPWKTFKKLYKLAEAPALAGKETDLKLLGALLGRIDSMGFSTSRRHLELLPETPAMRDAKSVQFNNCEYSVGGRNNYDYSGWRLRVRVLEEGKKSGGLLGALEIVKSALTHHEATQTRAFDFNARDWMGTERRIGVKNGLLEIEVRNYGRTKTFRLDISDPLFPHFADEGPRDATRQYMKRRARRLLRKLSIQRPELYLPLLRAMWQESRRAQLDPATHWASMDALFARSTRWRQTLAGRGPYQIVAPRFHLKTREERAPALWDAHLDWTREVFLDETVPLEANAAALRVLRANKVAEPTVNANQLRRFLDGGELLLQTYATRVLVDADDLQSWPAEALAAALLLSGAPARRRLREFLEARLQDASTSSAWRRAFAAQLAKSLGAKTASRRVRTAAGLLVTTFREEISDSDVFAHLAVFLEASREDNQWLFERIRARGKAGDMEFLNEIANLPLEWRERVLQEFSSSARDSRPTAKSVIGLITKDDAAQNRIGWQFLAATAMQANEIRELWKSFSMRWYSDEVFEAAFNEAASGQLWRRAEWKPEEALHLVVSREYNWLQYARHFGWEFLDAVLQSLPPSEVPRRVFISLGRMAPDVATRVLRAYGDTAQNYAPTGRDLLMSLFDPSRVYEAPAMPDGYAPAWEFLAKSAVTPEVLRENWRLLFSPNGGAGAFGDAAAQVFSRAQIPVEDVAKWLSQDAPIQLFSPRFFLTLLDLVAPEQKAALLLLPSDEQWQGLRAVVLDLLREDTSVQGAFWRGVWNGLESNPRLMARFDDEFRANFNTLSVAAFSALLPSANDANETLAMNWLSAHEAELRSEENLETLILTATHALDEIRLWGLRQVRARGLDVPVALRLMESGLPQPFAFGREYFESAPRESARERDYALALCDSPKPEVQAYGREFLLRRASTLLDDALLQQLAEHPDAAMQAWVAEQLLKGVAVRTEAFDTAILRARGKARRAKESVKKRLGSAPASTPAPDASALLELARGNTARDREWALQQLAKRALSGEEIRGLEIGPHHP